MSKYKAKKAALKKIKARRKKVAGKATGGSGYLSGSGGGGGGYISGAGKPKRGSKEKMKERLIMKKFMKKAEAKEKKLSKADEAFRAAVMAEYDERLERYSDSQGSDSSGQQAPALSRGNSSSYSQTTAANHSTPTESEPETPAQRQLNDFAGQIPSGGLRRF